MESGGGLLLFWLSLVSRETALPLSVLQALRVETGRRFRAQIAGASEDGTIRSLYSYSIVSQFLRFGGFHAARKHPLDLIGQNAFLAGAHPPL